MPWDRNTLYVYFFCDLNCIEKICTIHIMDGILVINKPMGMTSHDVINRLRKKYHQKKFGHTGTLDPDASGVLVVLCGKACKVLQFLADTDKRYIAEIELGRQTSTDDSSGKTLIEKPVSMNFDFENALKQFEGPLHQLVPMTSNKKVHGKKLLEYQREGLDVPKVHQDVTIYSIRSLGFPKFEVYCSSGTYIRSICRDLALSTGNVGCMKSLCRTAVGRFTLDRAQCLDEEPILYSIKTVLAHLPMIEYDNTEWIKQGKPISLDNDAKRVCITENQEPIAIYDRKEDDLFYCKRGLW